jgi:hypothetical protein
MNFDLEDSVKNRDAEFELAQAMFLYKNYVEGYKREIHKMKNHPEFKRDDTYHSIKSKHHITYKYIVSDNGDTELYSSDGNRAYEFLIEFDKEEASYGIYYGCRGLVKGGDQKEQNAIFAQEWDELKYDITEVLNNTFQEKDFSKRFRMTNNANNKTYWPFWIMLYDDEDVVDVAALAVKLIFNIYKRYIKEGQVSAAQAKAKKYVTKTSFTQKDYEEVLKTIKKKDRFELFIRNAVACGYLERDERYDVCYRFVNVNNVIAAFIFRELSENLGEIKSKSGIKTNELKSTIPWKLYKPIFLTESSGSIDSLKASLTQSEGSGPGDNAKQAKLIFEEIMAYKEGRQ